MIDLTYPSGTLTPEARTALADELSTVLLRAERAPDTGAGGNVIGFEQLRQLAAQERERPGEAMVGAA
jgi:hypothetical protein